MLAVISLAGSAATLAATPLASTPWEYGGLFVGFLIFLGFGVLAITVTTAGVLLKKFGEAMAKMGGDQAAKVFAIDSQEETDARFKSIEEASERRASSIVDTLKVIQANITEQTTALKLLQQHVEAQVERGDELRDVIKKDVEELQGVFRRRRNDTDETRRPT